MYTLGEPSPEIRKFIDWIRSPDGQKVVAEAACVPLP
jgi:ABC-type phosphate transport system substrate-binding protein